jgi:hypothetical protein
MVIHSRYNREKRARFMENRKPLQENEFEVLEPRTRQSWDITNSLVFSEAQPKCAQCPGSCMKFWVALLGPAQPLTFSQLPH